MERSSQPTASPTPAALTVLAAAGLAWAIVAAFTRPFTLGADVVTALPLGLAAMVFTVRTRSARRSRRRTGGPSEGRSDKSSPATSRAQLNEATAPLGRGAMVWLALAASVLAWELFVYSQTPRSAHPTLSALIDSADASLPGKALMFGLWLALGCYLVRQ